MKMLSADSVKQERKNTPEVKYFLLFKELWILVRNNVEHLHEHFQKEERYKDIASEMCFGCAS